MVARPALAEADFARVRQLRLHRLTQLRDMPGAVADRVFVKLLYGEPPVRAHAARRRAIAERARRVDDVRRFHGSAIKPSETTLIAVGDCDHDAIERLAGEAFAGWERRCGPRRAPGHAAAAAAAVECRPATRCSAVRTAHRSRGGGPQHARLPRARGGEHGARWTVREPDQSEPARGQGLHLRRAHRVRFPAAARPVFAERERADGGHRRAPSGIARRNRRHPRPARGHDTRNWRLVSRR